MSRDRNGLAGRALKLSLVGPTCVGTWATLGLLIGRMALPGPTRFVTRVLATGPGSPS